MTAPAAPAPGFYADPLDPTGQRWWDGSAWTETIRGAEATSSGGSVEADGAVASEDQLAEDSLADLDLLDDELVEEYDENDPAFVPRLAPDPLPGTRRAPAATPAVVNPAVEPSPSVGVPEEAAATEPAADVAAAAAAAPTVPPGLYPDPYGQAPLRWWDGGQWTVQTSDSFGPEPQAGGRGDIVADGPRDSPTASVPMRSDVLPPPRRPGGPWPRQAPKRGWSSYRPTARVLAAAVILLLGLGARVYFFLGRDDPAPAPAQVAQAINLRSTDLPRGWTVQADPSAGQSGDAAADVDLSADAGPALARCVGAPDPKVSGVFDASSPTFVNAAGQVSSDVTVVRDAGMAAADIQAMRSPKLASCFSTFAAPALKKSFAARGIAVSGFTVTRLPGAPVDGYAVRMTWTLTSQGRSMPLHSDAYGFRRGTVEVELSSVRVGTAPDAKLSRQLLQQLEVRASDAAKGD